MVGNTTHLDMASSLALSNEKRVSFRGFSSSGFLDANGPKSEHATLSAPA